jgi:hypothetical protein
MEMLDAKPSELGSAAFKRRWCEQDEKMRPGADVFEDDAFKVTAGDAQIIKKRVIAMVGQVLVDSQRPGSIGAPVTDEHGFLDAAHVANV